MVQPTPRFFAAFLTAGFVFALFFTQGCSDKCPEYQEVCTDTPPIDELCQAYFQRWFFDASTNQCQQIGYSGCGQYGFATQAECQACQCSE
jgi:hypothetical protein